MYKKYLLSVFVLFIAFAVIVPSTASAFWPFDWLKKDNVVQVENTATVQASDTPSICQIVELFISLAIIPSDKVAQARQAVSGDCSSGSSSSNNDGGGGGGGGSTTPKISILSPGWGEALAIGSSYNIDWISQNTPNDKLITISTYNPVKKERRNMIVNTVNDGTEQWTVPTSLSPGQEYYLTIEAGCDNLGKNCFSSGSSSMKFEVVISPNANTNGLPRIDGIAVIPSSIKTNQIVPFSFIGSDPDSDGLRWSINWGDGEGSAQTCVREWEYPNTNFKMSHAWVKAGTYKVRTVVNDCKGGTSKYDVNIPINESSSSSSSSKPSITVLSPNGGEKWQVGKTYKIRWNPSIYDLSQVVAIGLLDSRKDMPIGGNTIANTSNSGEYNFIVPASLNGENVYRIVISLKKDNGVYEVMDGSDMPFSIISASSTQNLPDLMVSNLTISPSVATVGQEILLRATLSNIGNVVANANYNVDLGYQGMASKSDQNICYRGIDLNPGEKCLIAMKVKYSSPVSSNKIRIMVDPGNYIKELNETNNTKSISFPIYDISISSSSSSSKSADITAETGKVESYSNGARVYGTIGNPNKENVWYYFKYRKEADPLTETKQSPWTSINGQTSGGAVIFLYNLLPNTKYVYQLYAYSYTSGKTVNGELKSFTTLSSSSTLTLTDLSSISTLIDNGTSAPATSSVAFRFTMNNRGTSDLYVSKNPSVFVATSSTSGSLGNLTLVSADATTLSGDSLNAYFIPSGSSRKFTLDGSFGKNGTAGTMEFKITKIYFDDDTMGLQEFNIDSGLEKLGVVETF